MLMIGLIMKIINLNDVRICGGKWEEVGGSGRKWKEVGGSGSKWELQCKDAKMHFRRLQICRQVSQCAKTFITDAKHKRY